MKGTLPEELRHLRYLKELNIIYNKGVTGSIPFQYGSLKHMSFCECVFPLQVECSLMNYKPITWSVCVYGVFPNNSEFI